MTQTTKTHYCSFRMSNSITETSTIDFVNDEFLNKDSASQAFRLPPWENPDEKIAKYVTRRQKHRVMKQDYRQRFIAFKTMTRKMKIGNRCKPPSKTFIEFLEKVMTLS